MRAPACLCRCSAACWALSQRPADREVHARLQCRFQRGWSCRRMIEDLVPRASEPMRRMTIPFSIRRRGQRRGLGSRPRCLRQARGGLGSEGGGELARPKVWTPDAASCPLPSTLCNQRLLGGFCPAQLYRVSIICFCGIFGAFGTRCHVHGTVCHDWFRPSKCSDWPHRSSSPISISLLRVASVGQALKDDASDQNGPGFQSVSLLSHGDRARSLRGLGAGAQLGTDRQCWTTQDRLVHARSQLNAGRHLVDIDAYRDALGKAHP